ncbi:MAG: GatB/YqeY domain-containing protein [Deltaproteobacteria bacterium]|nr:GatB/YqeY domain-containing protein [Deltaproteobacteria bacterium]
MSIEAQLATRLKEAMQAKRTEEVNVIRMVKTLAATTRTAPGFDRPIDDAFWLDIISKYVKQQQRALSEFEQAGDQGAAHVKEIRFEIEYLAPFLPRTLGEDDVRRLVKQAIAETGAAGGKMVGRVMGVVMKVHKDEVDAATVKRIAEEELG